MFSRRRFRCCFWDFLVVVRFCLVIWVIFIRLYISFVGIEFSIVFSFLFFNGNLSSSIYRYGGKFVKRKLDSKLIEEKNF